MSKIHVNPGDVEAASKATWAEVFVGKPDKAWDLVAITCPEMLDAHRKLVGALLAHGGDLTKAIPEATGGKFRYGYGGRDTIKFHDNLAAAVKTWANKRGL